MNQGDIASLARRVLHAFDTGTPLASFSTAYEGFDVAAAYDVLREAERARVGRGWKPVGRKIGFTNRTIWPRYGVFRPMWAHVWAETVTQAPNGSASISLAPAALPRIEPEVVFGLRGTVPPAGVAREVLDAVEWIAPGFEIVQSHFPDWKFTSGRLHGRIRFAPRPGDRPARRAHRCCAGRLCGGAAVVRAHAATA